jgi:SAM-dependent methyltransferase
MNFFKKSKKWTYLEIVLCMFFIVLIIVFLKPMKEGFVEEHPEFIRKTDDDIFDNFYVNMYDNLVYDTQKNDFEVERIFKNLPPQPIILDIGSGSGHHVNSFNINNNSVIGIDKSPAMIQLAKHNYPNLDFRLSDALDSMQFSSNTFTHITCLYFTIYYIKNKLLFFENCFKWLQPHGVLVLHLVDIYNFDPVLSTIDTSTTTPQSNTNERNTKSNIKFNILDYKSDFILDKIINPNTTALNEPNATFKETFKFNNGKKARINEHKLYMSSQASILALARDVGFILLSQEEMGEVDYKNNYLYTLQKPS